MKDVRLRYAPSPTGHFHIGGARTVIFNWLYARKHQGKFIIRFEDTDLQRQVEGGEKSQLDGISWLGLDWDESTDVGGPYAPYRSMERLSLYQPYIEQLIAQRSAYPCFCTEEELEQEREAALAEGVMAGYSGKCRDLSEEQIENHRKNGRKPAIRFKVPHNEIIRVEDQIRGTVEFSSNDIGDFVLVRPDGAPLYNLAVTIDDYLMNISHVLRGDEHLSNTPRQVLIYQALGWEPPVFAHASLIVNENRKKLSKRDESIIQFVEQYRELGYIPEALVNFVALLGWTPEGEQEIFTKEELIKLFSLERVSKSPAVFDTEKLKWMNGEYIKKAPLDRVVSLCRPHLEKAGYIASDLSEEEEIWVSTLVSLYQEQLRYGAEIVPLTSIFFQPEAIYEEEGLSILQEEQVPTVLRVFLDNLQAEADFTPQAVQAALKQTQKSTGFKGKQLFMPVRVAITGQVHGRDLAQTIALLGKEKVVERLNRVIDNGASFVTK